MAMILSVGREGEDFTLYVNGLLAISRQSMQVVDGVRYFLEHPEADDGSELAKVARAIRRGVEKRRR